MFNKIVTTLNTCNCEKIELPTITRKPHLKTRKEEIKTADQKTVIIPKGSQCIEADVDFKDSSNLERYKISEEEGNKSIKINFIEIKRNKKEDSESFLHTNLSQETISDLSSMKNSFKQTLGPNQFVLSLKSANTETDHPLINYLKNNLSSACEICLIFQAPVNNSISEELIKAIEIIETENQSLINFCSQEFEIIINKIKTDCSIVGQGFIEIIDYLNISEKFKTNIKEYFYQKESEALFNQIMFSNGVNDKEKQIEIKESLEEVFKNKNDLQLNAIKELKHFLKEKIKEKVNEINKHLINTNEEEKLRFFNKENRNNEMNNHSIYINEEETLRIFNEEIDSYNETLLCNFFKDFFAKLKNKTKEASQFFTLETDFFNYNIDSGQIELVKYDVEECDVVEIKTAYLCLDNIPLVKDDDVSQPVKEEENRNEKKREMHSELTKESCVESTEEVFYEMKEKLKKEIFSNINQEDGERCEISRDIHSEIKNEPKTSTLKETTIIDENLIPEIKYNYNPDIKNKSISEAEKNKILEITQDLNHDFEVYRETEVEEELCGEIQEKTETSMLEESDIASTDQIYDLQELQHIDKKQGQIPVVIEEKDAQSIKNLKSFSNNEVSSIETEKAQQVEIENSKNLKEENIAEFNNSPICVLTDEIFTATSKKSNVNNKEVKVAEANSKINTQLSEEYHHPGSKTESKTENNDNHKTEIKKEMSSEIKDCINSNILNDKDYMTEVSENTEIADEHDIKVSEYQYIELPTDFNAVTNKEHDSVASGDDDTELTQDHNVDMSAEDTGIKHKESLNTEINEGRYSVTKE
ncbi:hypothetical protein CDIK_3554, partial [Cucumispora dikerogammari]